MLEPSSLFLLILLLVAAALALRAGATRRRFPGQQLVAGVTGLVLAFTAGLAEVNHYFGYYRTWGDLITDANGGPNVDTDIASVTTAVPAASRVTGAVGHLLALALPGPLSHVTTRTGYVWLPPDYAALQRAGTQLPVLMLIHGSPGSPTDWITALHIDRVLDIETDKHRIGPIVVVLVPANPKRTDHEECVNAVAGVQDETYVAQDVPDDIGSRFDVLPPGPSWGIGGFSSGGYCAANIALRHSADFGAVVDLDGYLHPRESGDAGDLFGSDAVAERENDIVAELQRGVPSPLPAFFLAAGTDREDETDALTLQRLLEGRESVPVLIEHGGAHTFYTWAAAIPGGIDWSWRNLAPPVLQRRFPTLDPAVPGRADTAVGGPIRRRRPGARRSNAAPSTPGAGSPARTGPPVGTVGRMSARTGEHQ